MKSSSNMTMTIIIVISIVTASAIALPLDHLYYDNIPITAIFQHEVTSFLNYAKDYVSSTASFLISIEDSVISKQKDYLVTTPSLHYSTIEDIYEKTIEEYQVNITVEVTVVE